MKDRANRFTKKYKVRIFIFLLIETYKTLAETIIQHATTNSVPSLQILKKLMKFKRYERVNNFEIIILTC